MQQKQALMWLKGRRVIVCDTDPVRLKRMCTFFEGCGVNVLALKTAEEVIAEIEKHHYSTHRIYLAVLIDQSLAKAAAKVWGQVTHENPTILTTPVVLMRKESDLPEVQSLIDKGYFKYQLDQSPSSKALLRLLISLNRWKKWQKELSSRPHPSVSLKR
ncbi:hypothetical protein P8629_04865 [Hydrogenovibrio sp. 3SP14C1]|uniref:hypothetical protein n=1 Tax=Hydrogenovibrio sp. 3SP14C1 TaxID=3038774 RepID=UPI0024178D50|nr:hypothetical protein [Hydrogenovibrio sp. 3SP14C1]MDG4812330.1 hypothetical protein [Hydrogenovibrio sp. 3SP14C1]